MVKAGIIGSTGYAGQQLAWILNQHPKVEIAFLNAHSNAGTPYSDIYGNCKGFIDSETVDWQYVEAHLNEIDVLFISLPHGKSFDIVKKALELGVKVIDLGADYRLKDTKEYREWYGLDHENIEGVSEAVYGLPELNREDVKKARLIANPGCYPTASILGLSPLLANDLIDKSSIIIDAKSGVSGAGRSASIGSLYCEVNESIKAYGVATHRHTPEIEQVLGSVAKEKVVLSFTPHLTPMNRGILATCYAKLNKDIDTEELYKLYREFYKDEFFVKVIDVIPETRWVRGSNLCHIGIKVDKRTGRVVVVSAIDNLMKGAASQAVQNMNIMFGFNETTAIEFLGMMP